VSERLPPAPSEHSFQARISCHLANSKGQGDWHQVCLSAGGLISFNLWQSSSKRSAQGVRMRVWPGRRYPLGATWDGAGVNFALFSEHATKVELCLFETPDSTTESHHFVLPEQTDQVWHGYFPDVQPDQLYGYRVHGPYEPAQGHRFNSNKVVLDP